MEDEYGFTPEEFIEYVTDLRKMSVEEDFHRHTAKMIIDLFKGDIDVELLNRWRRRLWNAKNKTIKISKWKLIKWIFKIIFE